MHMATGILIYEDNISLRESLNTLLALSPNYQVLDSAPMSPSIARMIISHMHETTAKNDYQSTAREKEICNRFRKGAALS
jgi:hypothetical protein